RWVIMLNKFFTLGVFITFAFTMMSVVIGIGSTLLGLIVGHYMGAFDMTILGNFLGELLPQMALTFIGTFIAAGYAALAAMISRHVMATIIIGVVATIGEPSTLIIVSMVRGIFKIDLYGLFLMTPSYNINNITMQLNGAVYIPLAPEGFIPFTLLTSWLILIAWVVGLVILSVRIFSRQDITS
ncbi:MAG TPA: hypothetical protein PLZ51_17570, partial [Aggregatilineales bacterium]|nr:hypothetical protein [Aggregatilineales bacterium]